MGSQQFISLPQLIENLLKEVLKKTPTITLQENKAFLSIRIFLQVLIYYTKRVT
jgi:hypothetical protein